MKIGVIAGVFDPFHTGHLAFIEESIKAYDLDQVLILIEKKPKFKRTFASFNQRKKIIELSIKHNTKIKIYPPASASFPISSTLPVIKDKFDAEIYLLAGDDVKEHIYNWPEANRLLENIELITAERSGAPEKQISSGKVREQIKDKAEAIDMAEDALEYCRANNLIYLN